MGRAALIGVVATAWALGATGCSIGAFGDFGGSGDTSVEQRATELAGCRQGGDPARAATLVVWFEPGASESTLTAIDTLIDQTAGVESAEYIDIDATYAEFLDFYEDQPDIIDLVEAEQLWTSYRVQFARTDMAATIEDDLVAVGGVQGVELQPDCGGEAAALTDACEQQPAIGQQDLVVVWLDVLASADQAAAIEREIRATPGVLDVDYIDSSQTAAEFTESYRDDPEIIELVDLTQLPTSFRVLVERPEVTDQVRNQVSSLPGYDSITGDTAVGVCEASFLD